MMFYRSSPGISRKGGVDLNGKGADSFGNGTDTFRAPEAELYNQLKIRNAIGTTAPTLTSKVDVYAFAMIMYILLYGNRLWHLGLEGLTDKQIKEVRSKRGLVADKKCNRPPLGDRTVLGDKAPRFSSPETIENWKISSALENYAMKRDDRCQYKAWNGQTNEWEADTTATASSVDYMTPHTEDYIKLM
jgi:hypothetical protein